MSLIENNISSSPLQGEFLCYVSKKEKKPSVGNYVTSLTCNKYRVFLQGSKRFFILAKQTEQISIEGRFKLL